MCHIKKHNKCIICYLFPRAPPPEVRTHSSYTRPNTNIVRNILCIIEFYIEMLLYATFIVRRSGYLLLFLCLSVVATYFCSSSFSHVLLLNTSQILLKRQVEGIFYFESLELVSSLSVRWTDMPCSLRCVCVCQQQQILNALRRVKSLRATDNREEYSDTACSYSYYHHHGHNIVIIIITGKHMVQMGWFCIHTRQGCCSIKSTGMCNFKTRRCTNKQ